jgi:hypothetical protein
MYIANIKSIGSQAKTRIKLRFRYNTPMGAPKENALSKIQVNVICLTTPFKREALDIFNRNGKKVILIFREFLFRSTRWSRMR